MSETTEQPTLYDDTSPLDTPAATDYDNPTDFSSFRLEDLQDSLGQDTHRSDTPAITSYEDHEERFPADSEPSNTSSELFVPQSALPLKLPTEPSPSSEAQGTAFMGKSGVNDPLQPFTLAPTYQCPPSSSALIGKAIVSAFITIGGELESDWHAIAGLLLLAAGLFALSQHPPLIMLAVALWIAAATVLTARKSTSHKTHP